MINVSEIRIGNLVYRGLETGKEVITIEEIRRSDAPLVRYSLNGILTIAYQQELVGIPLTEEWLLKLGFSKSALPFSDGVYEGPIIDHRVEYNAGSFMYCLWSQHLRNMEHVHQLQNLYHALTGEELTIKEPTE